MRKRNEHHQTFQCYIFHQKLNLMNAIGPKVTNLHAFIDKKGNFYRNEQINE